MLSAQIEQESSRWNFDVADRQMLLMHFENAEAECQRFLADDGVDPNASPCGS